MRLLTICDLRFATCAVAALLVGCATSRTVEPLAVARTEPPPVVEAPLEMPKPVGSISAPGQVQEPLPGGAIDWSGKTIRARGTGVLDPGNSNTAQARSMAERAATVVARRNLLEIIKGVRIDSDTRVRDFTADNDVARQYVEGIDRKSVV